MSNKKSKGMKTEPGDVLKYRYTFIFQNGREKVFEILLDKKTLNIIRQSSEEPPEWARYENFECAEAECAKRHNDYCPLAVNMQDILQFFSDIPSYEKVTIRAEANERIYMKETSVQSGVGSLLGLIMPTSGCPVLAKLKPLVRFHLPFASIEETEFRVFSMYLLAQYVLMRQGREPDWEMKNLKDVYEQILRINRNVSSKIADLENKDASINAVVALDNFAQFVKSSLDESDLSDIEQLFKEWF